ncbi:hypothetical protein Ga0466249_000794 [Sporomusaceae bacterium BoRhaA]|uniref:hypothetical protein n=1 Tax=Pelorhabdus rhamnosifermentans TaxID=2772457 RepID=UPI001C064621|nr:hypothetical protein [Pelorhabdus rhamnosifermentans]MBU2699713.1 hypothetical protein [Pelorhabdus rhamnosifermentans]
MKKKIVIVSFTFLSILLFVGFIIKNNYSSQTLPPEPIVSEPTTETVLPTSTNNIQTKVAEPASAPAESVSQSQPPENTLTESLNITPGKIPPPDNPPQNLADYNYSIKKEEKKNFELAPGVTVSKRTVHIKLDHDSDNIIDIQKNSPNVTWKSKF